VVLDLSSMEKRPYLSNDRDFVAAAIQRIFQVSLYRSRLDVDLNGFTGADNIPTVTRPCPCLSAHSPAID